MKYFGQFDNPKVDEYLHKEFFSDKSDGFYIECGAYDGLYISSCKIFKDMGWTGLNIEADPDIYKKLCKNRPNECNLNYALTDKENSNTYIDFFDCKFNPISHKKDILIYGDKTGLGSISKQVAKESKKHFLVNKISTKGISFYDLIEEQNIHHIDLFVLDVEGAEEQVIKGMRGCRVLPKVICIEILPTGLDTLNNLLLPMGYKNHSVVHCNAHYVIDRR